MRKPVTINIGSAGKATDNVTQHITMAKDNDKPRLLEDWINEVRGEPGAPWQGLPYSTYGLVQCKRDVCAAFIAFGSLWQRSTSKHPS